MKAADDYFTDWEGVAFGFGYGNRVQLFDRHCRKVDSILCHNVSPLLGKGGKRR